MEYEMDCQTINGLVGPEMSEDNISERQNRRYREARDDPYEDEIPTPPTLIRQAAVTGPLSVREQELRFIAEHGLVAFCQGIIVTALLEDADYLLAQLTYLGRR